MPEKKRYYWLKLKEDFFRDKPIKKLRSIAGGDTYTIIYLKMLLKSLENEGVLYYEGLEPTFEEELALDLDEDAANVQMTVSFLEKAELLEKSDTIAQLTKVPEMIGSESTKAELMRRKRERERGTLLPNVTTELPAVTSCYPEIDKEKDKDKEIYKQVISYLNQKAGSSYRSSSTVTQKHINGRLAEGFTLDDFKKVIDKKCAEWLGSDMAKFLRPETLFGTKFESYLNAPDATKKTDSHNFKERDYDYDDLAKRLRES